MAFGSGVSAEGGAIYDQGTLDLNGVTVQNNIAQGNMGQSAAGGGIYSSGSLKLEGSSKVQNNQALGGQGRYGGQYMGRVYPGGRGGDGFGGALYISWD
jgi:hypothetical protein